MQLENINIEFIQGTEVPDPDNPLIHYVDAHNMETLEECKECGCYMVPKTHNYRPVIHYCKGPDGQKRIYHINLCSQRYECTNPITVHSETAGMLSHKSPYTEEYKKYVIQLFLNTEKCSFSQLARMLKHSQPIVSKLINDFAQTINTRFAPRDKYESYYLHGFMYQNKYRYFLTRFDYRQQPELLSFFGFTDDPWVEIDQYLQKYWNDTDRYYHFFIDEDPRLNKLLDSQLKKVFIDRSRYETDQRIERFLKKYSGTDYYFLLEVELKNFKKMLQSDSFDDWYKQWPDSFTAKEAGLQGALDEFLEMIKNEYNLSYFYQQMPDHTNLISSVNYYKAQRLPFNVMVLKMMYSFHPEAFSVDENTEPAVPDDGYFPEDDSVHDISPKYDNEHDFILSLLLPDDERLPFPDDEELPFP